MEAPRPDRLPQRVDRLERQCRRLERQLQRWKLLAVVVAAALLSVACRDLAVRSTHAQQPDSPRLRSPSERPSDPEALYEDQRRLATRALSIIDQATRRGIPAVDQASQEYSWSTRRLGAQIYLSLRGNAPKASDPDVFLSIPGIGPDPQRLAAFDAHLRRMKNWEQRLNDVARRGAVSILDLTVAEWRRLQAETWLARERLKSTDPPPDEKK